jgi:hypothetical protein
MYPPCFPAQGAQRHNAMEETLDAYGEEIIPALEAKSDV